MARDSNVQKTMFLSLQDAFMRQIWRVLLACKLNPKEEAKNMVLTSVSRLDTRMTTHEQYGDMFFRLLLWNSFPP